MGLSRSGKRDVRLFVSFLMLLRDDADCRHRAAPIHDQPPFKTGLPLIELRSVNMRNEIFLFSDICMRNLTGSSEIAR